MLFVDDIVILGESRE